MLQILKKAYETGIVSGHDAVSEDFRGRPEFAFDQWVDARPAAAVCPTRAIWVQEGHTRRTVTVDYGRCIFCGECAQASPEAIRTTTEYDLAVTRRQDLVAIAEYSLQTDGSHHRLL